MTNTLEGSRTVPYRSALSVGRRRLAAALTLAASAIAGLAVWAIAVPIAGQSLVVPSLGRPVNPISIVIAALVTGAAAWLLVVLLRRFRHGLTMWTAIGCCVLVLSLAGPPLAGAAGSTLVVLEIMHIAVGAVLIVGLRLAMRVGRMRRTAA